MPSELFAFSKLRENRLRKEDRLRKTLRKYAKNTIHLPQLNMLQMIIYFMIQELVSFGLSGMTLA